MDERDRPELFSLGEALPHATAVTAPPPGADVIFPNWGPRRRAATGAAEIHWIPDLQHRRLPGNFGRVERLRRDLGYRRLIRPARRLIVSSNAVAADVRAAYRSAASKLRVVPFRTALQRSVLEGDPAETRRRLDVPDRFILLANQFWAHKNHATAFAALDGLPLPLVCTGEARDLRRPGFAEQLLATTAEARAKGRLRVLGVVERSDYLQLVRSASVVLQPSLFEGWSSIVEDARAFGRPVALSGIDVHREQSPERGHFFTPLDADALVTAVTAALAEPEPTEATAVEEQRVRVREYAERFLEVAHEARSAL